MNETLWFGLLASFLLLSFVVLFILFTYSRNLKAKLLQSVGLIDNLHQHYQKTTSEIASLQSKIKKLESKHKPLILELDKIEESNQELKQQVQTLDRRVDELLQQDPELKLYAKANKLVAAGEDIEDVIEASGLPRAEVEMLFDVHRRK